jgi:hypothetical protein
MFLDSYYPEDGTEFSPLVVAGYLCVSGLFACCYMYIDIVINRATALVPGGPFQESKDPTVHSDEDK